MSFSDTKLDGIFFRISTKVPLLQTCWISTLGLLASTRRLVSRVFSNVIDVAILANETRNTGNDPMISPT